MLKCCARTLKQITLNTDRNQPFINMHDQITYLILAGGRGQRMNGQDKGLMLWNNRPMIEHVINQLQIPRDRLIISANRNLERYREYADKVIADTLDDYQGPLAGILSAMQVCNTQYLLCLPCDTPAPPAGMLQTLWHCMQQENRRDAICHDGERLQPLFCLLSCQHQSELKNFLQQGHRKVHDFMQMIEPAICDFSSQKNAFYNFNRAEDMQNVQQ